MVIRKKRKRTHLGVLEGGGKIPAAISFPRPIEEKREREVFTTQERKREGGEGGCHHLSLIIKKKKGRGGGKRAKGRKKRNQWPQSTLGEKGKGN